MFIMRLCLEVLNKKRTNELEKVKFSIGSERMSSKFKSSFERS